MVASRFDSARREVLRYVGVGAALLIPRLGVAIDESIVETASGRVRGFFANRVYAFKGVPYGASTAGVNRFMPPREVAPWAGVREALVVGPQSPQLTVGNPRLSEALGQSFSTITTMFQGVWEPQGTCSEDCLVLNVWTPALDDAKRPVMVWLHGGGFDVGSGGIPWYDGSSLARQNDVVLVSINHRLSVLGYLYLAAWDDKYADSGNVGMLDIVMALKWVKQNIAQFGGDPGNVTIFGQSAGGCKVNALMAMPAASGLFHRAIVQSGSSPFTYPPAEAARTAEICLKTLGLRPDRLDELGKIAASQMIDAIPIDLLAKLRPVVDGRSLPNHPFSSPAVRLSANVPMLVGTVHDEAQELSDDAFGLDEESLRAKVRDLLAGDEREAQYLISSYRQHHAPASPGALWTAIATDSARMHAVLQAERRLDNAAAPVYMYLFSWRSPFKNGKYGTPHNAELPFVFDNLDKALCLAGPHPDQRTLTLAKSVSGSWAAFALTGQPGHRALPTWNRYALPQRGTMVLNKTSKMVDDPQREDRLVMEPIVRRIQ